MKAFIVISCLVAVALADGDQAHAHAHEAAAPAEAAAAPAEAAAPAPAPLPAPIPVLRAAPLRLAAAPLRVAAPLPFAAPIPIVAPLRVAAPLPIAAPLPLAPLRVAAPVPVAVAPAYGAPPAPVEVFDPPVYDFGYGVQGDDIHGNARFAHNENRNGYNTAGEYRVALPDGRTQVVTYRVDDATSGYVADVKYEGQAIAYEAPRPAYAPA